MSTAEQLGKSSEISKSIIQKVTNYHISATTEGIKGNIQECLFKASKNNNIQIDYQKLPEHSDK